MAISEPKEDQRLAKGERRRQALIEAARDVFIERGYRATTLTTIIARAGGSREMIYKAFGDKNGLLGAIVRRSEADLIASIPQLKLRTVPVREVLIQFGLKLTEVWRTRETRAIHRMVLSEAADSPALLDNWFQSGPKLAMQELSDYLLAANEDRLLTVKDPEAMARNFHALLAGLVIYPHFSGKPPGDPAQGVADVVDVLLAGCGPLAAPSDIPSKGAPNVDLVRHGAATSEVTSL